MPESHSTEKGQAIILLVLGVVAFMGFVALAIDGGMVYSDRSYARNAADAAALAGAGIAALDLQNAHVYYGAFECDSSDARVAAVLASAQQNAVNVAINRAVSNGFFIDSDLSDHHGASAACMEIDTGSYIDKCIDITTQISSTSNTSFIHFVYPGPLINNIQTIARLRPSTPAAYGYAIVGLNQANCLGHQNGVMFSGDIVVNVAGGGVFSNGCLRGNGNSLIVDIEDADIRYLSELVCNPAGCPGFDPYPQQATGDELPEDSYAIEPPDCSGLPEYGRHRGGGTIFPGRYTEIDLSAAGDWLVMSPGLYCISGSPKAMTISGGLLEGYGVTIYATRGEVLFSGNADVRLSAPGVEPNPAPAIPGVLIYLAPGNDGAVEMEGNSDTWFVGTVYAPDGFIEAKGTSGTHPTFSTQFIAYNVEIGGTADIDIEFNDLWVFTYPARVELNE